MQVIDYKTKNVLARKVLMKMSKLIVQNVIILVKIAMGHILLIASNAKLIEKCLIVIVFKVFMKIIIIFVKNVVYSVRHAILLQIIVFYAP